MSPFARKRPQDEQPGGGDGELVDLDLRYCDRCRRELPAWAGTCPDDGGVPVRREELPPDTDPLLARFLDDPDD